MSQSFGRIIQSIPKQQLDYVASTDIHNGTTFSANTWTDVIANQSFVVDAANSLVQISAYGFAWMYGGVNAILAFARLSIDSSGSPQANQLRYVGGTYCNAYGNPISGVSVVTLTNLVAGTHTVKVQYLPSSYSGQVYLRAASSPGTDFLSVQVTELKK